MKHPYFKEIDFDALVKGLVPSPIPVATTGAGDISHFEVSVSVCVGSWLFVWVCVWVWV
jgi:hypothetical protein